MHSIMRPALTAGSAIVRRRLINAALGGTLLAPHLAARIVLTPDLVLADLSCQMRRKVRSGQSAGGGVTA